MGRLERRAAAYERMRLLRVGFGLLVQPYLHMRHHEDAVRAQRQWYVMRDMWRRWSNVVARARLRWARKLRRADHHYRTVLRLRCIELWKRGARLERAERQARLRRNALRSKVNSWLLDEHEGSVLPVARNPYS